MRILLIVLFLFTLNLSFSQDTTKTISSIYIYKSGKIIQKEFFGKIYIKTIYQYDESGVLIRRWWYNKKGELISVSLDD